jgi:hypothetical protein
MTARRLVRAVALLAVVLATPAHAHLLEITTSTAAPSADANQDVVEQAVRAAVATVVRDTAGFTPTLIVLTRALVVGDRLYLRLLLADHDGERAFRDLSTSPEGDASSRDRAPEFRL